MACIRHLRSAVRCMQGSSARFPSGSPGMAEEIEIAIQHAPHPGRQFIGSNVSIERGAYNRV